MNREDTIKAIKEEVYTAIYQMLVAKIPLDHPYYDILDKGKSDFEYMLDQAIDLRIAGKCQEAMGRIMSTEEWLDAFIARINRKQIK